LLLLRGFRDRQSDLVVIGLDLKKQIAFADLGAVLVPDLLKKALHARDEVNFVESRCGASQLAIERDLALLRFHDSDVSDRRRLIFVLIVAARERQKR